MAAFGNNGVGDSKNRNNQGTTQKPSTPSPRRHPLPGQPSQIVPGPRPYERPPANRPPQAVPGLAPASQPYQRITPVQVPASSSPVPAKAEAPNGPVSVLNPASGHSPASSAGGPLQMAAGVSPFAGGEFQPAARPPHAEIDPEAEARERRLRNERFAEQTFWEKVSNSGTLVLSYWVALFGGCFILMIFFFLVDRGFKGMLEDGSEAGLITLGASFLTMVLFHLLSIGFGSLILHIIEHGDPPSSFELLLTPFYRIVSILPPLLLWSLVLSMFIGGGLMIFGESAGGRIFMLAVILAMQPLSFCLVFYFAETREFGLAQAFTVPLKILAAGIAPWLSTILIMFCAPLVLFLALYLLGSFGFFFMILLWLVLFVGGSFAIICYVATFAGYTYRQCKARVDLDEE